MSAVMTGFSPSDTRRKPSVGLAGEVARAETALLEALEAEEAGCAAVAKELARPDGYDFAELQRLHFNLRTGLRVAVAAAFGALEASRSALETVRKVERRDVMSLEARWLAERRGHELACPLDSGD
jgi:hypothetical protein